MKIYLCIFLIFFILFSYGQVLNLDRENGVDSINKRFHFSLLGNASNDKQKNDLIAFNTNTEFDFINTSKMMLILLSQNDIQFNGERVLENNGYLQVRYRDNDTRHFAPDFFVQYQWNGVWGLKQRNLYGVNLRARWWEKRTSDLYTSFGIFYENEFWSTKLAGYSYTTDQIQANIKRDMFRLNTTVKYAIKINSLMDIAGITFIQFPINYNFFSPRWTFDINWYIKLNNFFSLILHYDHNYDNYRPLPIDSYYYSTNLGFQYKL